MQTTANFAIRICRLSHLKVQNNLFCERVGKQCSSLPILKERKEHGRARCVSEHAKGEEEIIMTRVAKLLAVATIPALLIAASGPLLAHGSGGGGGGGGGGAGAAGASGSGAGHGGGHGGGHGTSASTTSPGHAMHAAFPSPHSRGGHHGASSFSPGHAMHAAFPNPHVRGAHHGASSFAPGR